MRCTNGSPQVAGHAEALVQLEPKSARQRQRARSASVTGRAAFGFHTSYLADAGGTSVVPAWKVVGAVHACFHPPECV